jgi:hypothetical protein
VPTLSMLCIKELKFLQQLHERQVYPSKSKWLCGDEQCFAVLAKSCICYPET